jgi:Cu(I)/Ag(I) efflux system membrane fusion protein
MKKNIILLTWAFLILIAFSCNNNPQKAEKVVIPEQETTHVYYTCPMHPEVHSHEAGKCPACGMDLVKKETAMSDTTMIQHSM